MKRPDELSPVFGPILCIDASAPRSVVALGEILPDGARLLAHDARVDGANQASATLDQRIRNLFEQAQLEVSDLAMLGCARGPGTFTGTRVAVATAQGLALGLGIPIVPLSTLEAVAYSAGDAPGEGCEIVLALLDARRDEVYAQAFRRSETIELEALFDIRCASLASVLGELGESSFLAFGPGVEPYRAQLGVHALDAPGPTGPGLFTAARAAHKSRAPVVASGLEALYLRATYAEMGINKPKRPMFKSPFAEL